MREKTLKPWHGAAFFLLIMIVFFAICVPLQSHFGLYGVAATEIILLILALLFAKVMGIPCALCFRCILRKDCQC